MFSSSAAPRSLAGPVLPSSFVSLALRRILLVGGALATVMVLAAMPVTAQSLVINEFLASNDATIADENGDFDDWVEIFNPTASAIDLAGMFLTDDLSDPTASEVPGGSSTTVVPAGGFVILWFDKETEQGPLHVDAKLSSGGEQIGLFAANGSLIDSVTFGSQETDISEGRSPDGSSTFFSFPTPTPGASNSGGISDTTAIPEASQTAGFKTSPFSVALDSATSGAEIFYTTDGSEPTTDSQPYTGALSITDTTVLRARAFADGLLPSRIATWTWLFDIEHAPDFAVVTVTADPDEVFGPEGMFTLFEEDIEINAHFELFEPDGTLGLSQQVETEIHGSASASLPQKSLAIKAHRRFGIEELRYPVFPDQPWNVYRSLILRQSGQDWNYTMFRDAAASSLVRDLSDVGGRIDPVDVIAQGHRPAVLYLNGAYWGIQNIRDRFDRRYIKARYDLERDEIDLLDEETEAKEGDFIAWDAFQSFLASANLANPSEYAEFRTFVDPAAFIDHYAFQIAVDNADWPSNNNRRFRERTPDARWNFMIKDLDFSTGLFVKDGPWNSGDWTQDSLDRLLTPDWDWWPNAPWSTRAFQRAVESPTFRRDFVNRSADMLNVLFEPARWNGRLDEFEATYEPEMQRHLDRWNSGWNAWDSHVEKLRIFASNRAEAVRAHYVSAFADVTGTAQASLSVAGDGTLSFSTVNLSGSGDSYSGTWFTGVDIPVTAEAGDGFVFDHWSGALSGGDPSTSIVLGGNVSITAHFVPTGDRLPQTIDFGALPDRLTTDVPFEISATATSGLTVSFVVLSGPASVDGTTISLTGEEGTVTVRASQAGDANWLAAPDVDRSFTVNSDGGEREPQTIDFPPLSDRLTTSAPFEVTATASSGLEVELQVISGPATIAGDTITLTGEEGTVVVRANQFGNDDWLPAPQVDRSFAVTADGGTGGPMPTGYCSSIGNQPWQSWTQRVRFAGIDHTSLKEKYSDLSSVHQASVERGAAGLAIELTPGYSWERFLNTWRVWIDWNRDGDFDDAGELVVDVAPTNEVVTQNVAVPGNASLGTTRMRVTMKRNNPAGPCENFTFGEVQDYAVVTSGDGTGGPMAQAIDFPPLPDRVATAGPFNISASASSGLSVAFSIVSGPASIAGATVTLSGQEGTVVVRAEQGGNADWLPAPAVERSFEVLADGGTGGPMPTGYCSSEGSQPWQSWLERVVFAGIDHTSLKEKYSDWTADHQATVTRGATGLTIELTPAYSWERFLNTWRVWIDWNRDGDWNDAQELVLDVPATNQVVAGQISVPAGASLGMTRMRVTMKRDAPAGACENFTFGEVQDYAVDIR